MLKIVILGGGFGGIYSYKYLLRFSKFIKRNFEIFLVDEKEYFLFTLLLHEVAAFKVEPNCIIEKYDKILTKNCKFIQGRVEKIDLENKTVYLKDSTKEELKYDYLIISLGSKANFYNIPGAQENSFTFKSLEDAIKIRNYIFEKFENFNQVREKEVLSEPVLLNFVIVGGGATGVELAAELADYFYGLSKNSKENNKIKIILIEKGNELLMQFSPKLRKIAFNILKKKKVEIILNKGVKEINKDWVKLEDETLIKTNTVIWTAGVQPNLPELIGNIQKSKDGRLIVNEFLQLKNYDNVFVIGDICFFVQEEKPLPQLAQVAAREAKIAAKNILNLINKKPLEKFVYKHKGDLISLGRYFAIGKINGFNFYGIFAWLVWRILYILKIFSLMRKIKFL